MTDKQLLKLAAKAAGFEIAKWQNLEGWGEVRYGLREAIWNGEEYWNPLTDSGDALWLAVQLRLRIDIHPREVWVTNQSGQTSIQQVTGSQDPNALGDATRRAIVRAAAAIGEAMP